MEQVRHTIHEDTARLLPFEGKQEAIRPQLEIEALLIGVSWVPRKRSAMALHNSLVTARGDFEYSQ